MIPNNVETITMTKEDYDRNVEQLLVDKCIAEKKLEDIEFYIEQSDLKNMLWGKEILEIIGGNDDGTRNV